MDRLTAAAVRGGYLRSGADGLIWLPLGSMVRRKLRDRLWKIAPDDGVVEATGGSLRMLPASLAKEIHSFRDLPVRVRIQGELPGGPFRSLLRDSAEPDQGWLVAAADETSAQDALAAILDGLRELWARLGLDPMVVTAGEKATQWVHRVEGGPVQVLRCPSCGTAALRSTAGFHRGEDKGPASDLEIVETPGAMTIAALSQLLGIAPADTMKALVLADPGGDLLMILLRGDLELSEAKLEGLRLGVVRQARDAELRAAGLVPGYAGPVGLEEKRPTDGKGIRVLADASVVSGAGFVAGANRDGYHYRHVSFPRDFDVDKVVDLALPPDGAECSTCLVPLTPFAGIPLGWEERDVEPFDYGVEAGRRPGSMLSLRVSVAALLASMLDVSLHGDGLSWPAICSPFDVHALDLAGPGSLEPTVRGLGQAGLDVLVDDREASPGFKFSDAEWIGAPVWLISGRKSAELGGLEVRFARGQGRILPPAEAEAAIVAYFAEVM